MPFASSSGSNGSSANRWGPKKKKEEDPIVKLQSQIQNARSRLADSGVSSEIDDRNWFEKLTNLPKNQNAFFDALELLGRPGSAVMNMIDKGSEEGIGTAAWHGFSGEDRVRGEDLAEKMGVENGLGKFLLGTGIEIVTDPTNLIPGKVFVKGAQVAGKGLKTGAEALEKVAPALKTVREAATPIVDATKEGLGKMFIPQYGWERTLDGGVDDALKTGFTKTNNAIRFQTEEAMKGIVNAAKTTGIEAGEATGRLMEAPLRQTTDIPAWQLPDGTMTKNSKDIEDLIGKKQNELKMLNMQILGPGKVPASDRKAMAGMFDLLGNTDKGVLKTRATGLQDEIKQLQNTLKNPGIMQEAIKRPVRELSTDPKIQQAAVSLVKSNNELRQWALDTGIDVAELQGYMTHVLSAEERALRKVKTVKPIDRGNFGTGQPNKKVLNTRELMGSAEDINEQIGRKFFEPNAYFATAIGQKRLIEFANSAKFRRDVLSNEKFARPYKKGDLVPEGAEIINTNNYKFLKDDTSEALGLADEVGGDYIVTKGAKEALDRFQKLTTNEGVNAFLKAFDSAQSLWKRATLFSAPYHLRNDVGAKFNNWVGGMSGKDLIKYSASADADVYKAIIKGEESPLYREFREQGLGSSNLSKVEFSKNMEPEEAIQKMVTERSRPMADQVKMRLNPLRGFETSREVGDFVDQTNRFALYKWAREAKNMNPEQAAAKVKEVQFDYTNMTPFENEVASRVMPFYRWMRNNIPFQIRQFANDPRKFNNLNKVRLNAQEAAGIEEQDVPDWMKQSFAIPINGDGQGSGQFLSMNLPVGDLMKVSSPGKTLLDSITPLAKLPAELTLNRNFFYNKPIEQFEGQEKLGLPAKLEYALEQTTGQVGRGLASYLQQPEDVNQDTKWRTPSLGISSVVKDFDVNQARYYQLLNELQRLQDQMSYVEQQTGARPRTMAEIKKSGSGSGSRW